MEESTKVSGSVEHPTHPTANACLNTIDLPIRLEFLWSGAWLIVLAPQLLLAGGDIKVHECLARWGCQRTQPTGQAVKRNGFL